ncbi:unnamed protein product [Closterium sp. Yama58-4]|nr:unnamed protein product [Closterium sp. Yama58-4]
MSFVDSPTEADTGREKDGRAVTDDVVLTCTTFNMLAPIFKRINREGQRESEFRELWLPRSERILDTIVATGSSIVCLQECWLSHPEWVRLFDSSLGAAGYRTLKLPRTNNRGDGLMIAVKQDQWHVVDSQQLLFHDCGDRVAQIVYKLLERVEQCRTEQAGRPAPVILCGDLNGTKEGNVYKLLRSQGFLSSYDTAHHLNDVDETWVSHRSHRGDVCGVDYVWMLNARTPMTSPVLNWRKAVFGLIKSKLLAAGITDARHAFQFFATAGDTSPFEHTVCFTTDPNATDAADVSMDFGRQHNDDPATEEEEEEVEEEDEDEEAWRYYDSDEEGMERQECCITAFTIEDFQLAVAQLGLTGDNSIGLTEVEVAELMQGADTDGDGWVDFNEFQDMFQQPTWDSRETAGAAGAGEFTGVLAGDRQGAEGVEECEIEGSNGGLSLAVLKASLFPPEMEEGRWPEDYTLSDHAVLTVIPSSSTLNTRMAGAGGSGAGGRGGSARGGGAMAQELLLYLCSAGISALVLIFTIRQLDPNRAQSKQAKQRKREIAKRLGRPYIETNAYEDVIANDVINPQDIHVTFDSVGGLQHVKESLHDLVILPLQRPELFAQGRLLRPLKGVLLFGPPGTGKTLLAKAIAKECRAVFINVRIANLMSKWFGDAQKLVTAVFTLAHKLQPAIIFIDEVESFLGQRRNTEHEAVTSMKTEFMSLWDGFSTDDTARVMVLAATNRPWELDEAILRRLPRHFEIPLPDLAGRTSILEVILRDEDVDEDLDLQEIASLCAGYSGSDLTELCKQAAYLPLHDFLEDERRALRGEGKEPTSQRPLARADFLRVLSESRPSRDAAFDYLRKRSNSSASLTPLGEDPSAAPQAGQQADLIQLLFQAAVASALQPQAMQPQVFQPQSMQAQGGEKQSVQQQGVPQQALQPREGELVSENSAPIAGAPAGAAGGANGAGATPADDAIGAGGTGNSYASGGDRGR